MPPGLSNDVVNNIYISSNCTGVNNDIYGDILLVKLLIMLMVIILYVIFILRWI